MRVAFTLVGLVAASAAADTIVFVHKGFGSGTLNGVPFGPTTIVLTGTGDTSNRQPLGFGYWIDHDSATADISGVGVVTITSGTRTFVNNVGIVGFSRAGGGGADLFNGPFDSIFVPWDMLSSIGPVTGDGTFIQWDIEPVTTTGGVLAVETAGSPATFTATIGSVCYPDCEQDGDLDLFDFLCFQGAFADGKKYADCEQDGDLDIFDFLCFQGVFANGCN